MSKNDLTPTLSDLSPPSGTLFKGERQRKLEFLRVTLPSERMKSIRYHLLPRNFTKKFMLSELQDTATINYKSLFTLL